MDDRTAASVVTKKEFRAAINNFLQGRLDEKLKNIKEGDTESRRLLEERYQADNWISDAAERSVNIQQATHVVKFTHSSIKIPVKSSNLNIKGNDSAGDLLIGTHTVAGSCNPDYAVSDARHLDVYAFLHIEVAGETLLDFIVQNDPELQAAFSKDSVLAKRWMDLFFNVTQGGGSLSSHQLAKQLYWPLGGNEYHLLAPLFPSSLVGCVWQTIREDRFSDTAKAARAARRADEPYPIGYREYPDMVVQHFGGSNTQNVSRKNQTRFGENYLLRAVPPNWRSDPLAVPLYTDSVFERLFGARARVRELGDALAKFLRRASTANNLRIRETRAGLVGDLCNEMLLLAAELHTLPAGWSQHQDCCLNRDEQCWLDPQRAALDADFAAERSRGDWQLGISRRFGNWLNARLNKAELSMGQAEAEMWQSVVEQELRMIRMELEADD